MGRSFRALYYSTLFICWTLLAAPPLSFAEDSGSSASLRRGDALAAAPFTAEEAKAYQQEWAIRTGLPLIRTSSTGMRVVLLPPGEFTMGLTEHQFNRQLAIVKDDPKLKKNYGGMVTWAMLMMPAHRVRLTRPFYIGETEVTVGQFRKFADATGYRTEAERGLNHGRPNQGGRPLSTWRKPMAWRQNYRQQADEPVLHLCWNDCVAFCDWLSRVEGQEYCLPTEAQWEYACRAGTETPWHFGDYDSFDAMADQYAWWSDGPQGRHEVPRAVGLGRPNAFGLYDMHGNVWEYVADWWHRMTYKESPLNDPTGPSRQSEKNDQRRIIRGGSFDWGRWGGDSAYRMRITQRSTQHPHMGFRVAIRLPEAAGLPAAADPEDTRRRQTRDPGAQSPEVLAALPPAGGRSHPREVRLPLSSDVSMDFVLVTAGSFIMGSDQGDRDELPRHRVVISQPFYMAKYELTQSQWTSLMGQDSRLTELAEDDNEMSGPHKAMNGLSWNDRRNIVRRLHEKHPDRTFRLPSEAQWEYACRAGSTAEFSFGQDAAQLGDYAWYQGNMNWPGQPGFQGKAFYHDVGTKKPNAFGLYDMHGGVWEWCADRYQPDYYFTAPLVDPPSPAAGQLRVLRGGSWFRYGRYARSAYRRFFHPDADSDGVTAWILDFGCRVVMDVPQEMD